MKLDTLSVAPINFSYRNIHEMIRDYNRGHPVLVRGYSDLSGLTIDHYEESTLRSLGYKTIEFRYGSESKEVSL
jgi:hypothetical protein